MIQSVRGTKDILPEQSGQWQFIENIFRTVSDKYGYKEMRTPVFEKTEVFSRSIGESTDIVNKEMYTFTDRGGESITLRPEMTAAIARSILQSNLHQQGSALRIWYFGPLFRYERPQKGRLRQFHQYGAECILSPNPESDAEVILLANALIKSSGIEDYKLLINTLGSDKVRKVYKMALVDYLRANENSLSADSRARLEANPLRTLDSKDPNDAAVVAAAPNIIDFLDKESSEHFESVKSMINSAGLSCQVQPRLVRGLDYYSHTVFEFQHSALGAQDSFGGGGRYNGLFEQLGGKPTPAVGFAFGVERMLLILEESGKLREFAGKPDIYFINTAAGAADIGLKITESLRNKDFTVMSDLFRRSMKAQMREANKLAARYVLILGEQELANNVVQIKNMQDGSQLEIALDKIQNYEFK